MSRVGGARMIIRDNARASARRKDISTVHVRKHRIETFRSWESNGWFLRWFLGFFVRHFFYRPTNCLRNGSTVFGADTKDRGHIG